MRSALIENTRALLADAAARGDTALDEATAKALLAEWGIGVPKGRVLAGADEAANGRLADLRPPYAAKLIAGESVHKSDIGAVRLMLDGGAAVAAAIRDIERRAAAAGIAPRGFLVEEMAAKGVEVVVGAVHDARFGPCVMVGLGGIMVEVVGDVAFRVAPITADDARAMLDELAGTRLLDGHRGAPAADRERLVEILLAIGGSAGLLMAAGHLIDEIDLNPVLSGPQGTAAVDARIVLAKVARPPLAPAPPPLDLPATWQRFRPLFEPETIAVVGASATSTTFGNEVIRHSRALGYRGRIVPIHPKAAEIEGLAARPSLADLETPADFAYVAVGAEQAIATLEAGRDKARFALVMASGFGEVEAGRETEARLVAAARASGVRVIGPNCLGVHSSRGRFTFVGGASDAAGPVAVISQSGGLAVDMVLRGKSRGIAYSGIVTIGNAADLGPADFLECFLSDPGTRVIGAYLEDVKDGRRFLARLREAGAGKPVVLLVGGQTAQGSRAAASHTGSLAADARIWQAVARQTGAVVVETLDAFLDALLALQLLTSDRERPTRTVALFGNGGGTSVLAADAFDRQGLVVAQMPAAALARLEALQLPPGTSIANPVDTPAFTLRHNDGAVAGQILDILAEDARPDAIVVHVNLPVFTTSQNQTVDVIGNLVREAIRVRAAHPGGAHIVLVLRSDGAEATDARRRADRSRAIEAGIPVFDELAPAAAALAAVAHVERYRAAHGPQASNAARK
ncbi:MAG: acetate--CoA ligase family protein [Hyphomicrobiaceae bacterium]